jgi:hypothetical protein
MAVSIRMGAIEPPHPCNALLKRMDGFFKHEPHPCRRLTPTDQRRHLMILRQIGLLGKPVTQYRIPSYSVSM